MALSERQLAEKRKREAKEALVAALHRLPESVREGGALRVEAWKRSADEAWKLIRRDPQEAWKYEAALRELQACASDPPGTLALRAFGDKDQRKALAGGTT